MKAALFLVGVLACSSAFCVESEAALKETRLEILRQEQTEVQGRYADAVKGLATAQDKKEQQEKINRLRGDVEAIRNEIERVSKEKQVYTGKPANIAAPAAKVVKEPQETDLSEDWDVFKSFSKPRK